MKNHTGEQTQRENSALRKKMITTTLLVLCIAFIFHNSLEGAEVSGGRSFQLTQAMNGFLAEQMIRKLAHFSEYALEGVLVVSVIWAYGCKVRRYACHAALFGILTALIDETLQLFSDGRAALVGDVWIDFGGFLSGFLFGVLWMRLRRRIRGL